MAQGSVSLRFDSQGKRKAWLAPKLPEAEPGAESFDAKAFDLETKGVDKGALVFVLDEGTGNLAVRPLSEVSGGWDVAKGDFKLIGAVRVRVEHEGRPVESATVTLTDSKRSQTQVLDSSAGGTLSFWAVAPGEFKVRVLYRSGGKMADPLVQAFEVGLERAKPVPEFVCAIPDEVATIAPPAAATDKGKPPAKSVEAREGEPKSAIQTGSPIGSFITFLLTLAIVGGIGYAIYRWMQKHPDRVKARLQQLGVEVPEPPQDAGSPRASPSAPAPPEKILLGDAAAPAASVAPLSAAPAQPRLVRENGQVFRLEEGANVLGRADEAAISLPEESTISRAHAEIVRNGEHVLVRDLQSTNGTFVNGAQVGGEVELKPGDTVQFGAARFRYEA